jgi:membrane-bound lytic murein transglycosylase D
MPCISFNHTKSLGFLDVFWHSLCSEYVVNMNNNSIVFKTVLNRMWLTFFVTLFVCLCHFSLSFAAMDSGIPGQPYVSVASKPYEEIEREEVLNDPYDRISKDFNVPGELEQRTRFWFDIYTKYTAQHHVIHHIQYPWVVFRVIDTQPILDGPGHYWTRYHKAKKLVAKETRRVSLALKKIAATKNLKTLPPFEREALKILSQLKGDRRRLAKVAARNIRSQLGQRDFFLSGLASSKKYLPIIESDFLAAGLPIELSRLPFVESSFNIEAHSKVGASGIWQIMPTTGKNYLRIDQHIDERNSPLKASLAAIEIFKENYRILKSWPLAVTAYNHGPGGIRRGMRMTGSSSLSDIIQNYKSPSFQFASSNFYTSFLAALHAEVYHKEIFGDEIDSFEDALPIAHQVIVLRKPLRVATVARKLGLSRDRLVEYNYDLKRAAKRNIILPKGYKLILPTDTLEIDQISVLSNSKHFKEASL